MKWIKSRLSVYKKKKKKKKKDINLIKNSPFKLHNLHSRKGVKPSDIQEGAFCKNSQGLSFDNYFCRTPSQKSGLAVNIY